MNKLSKSLRIKYFLALFLLLALFSCGSNAEHQGKETKALIREPAKSRYVEGEKITFSGSGEDFYVDNEDEEGKWAL